MDKFSYIKSFSGRENNNDIEMVTAELKENKKKQNQ